MDQAPLTLEVGKWYRDGNGNIIEIYDKVYLTTHPYADCNGKWYRSNGRVGFFKASANDLVAEVDAPPPVDFFLEIMDLLLNPKEWAIRWDTRSASKPTELV